MHIIEILFDFKISFAIYEQIQQKNESKWEQLSKRNYRQIKRTSEIMQMFDSLCMAAANKLTDAALLADVSD